MEGKALQKKNVPTIQRTDTNVEKVAEHVRHDRPLCDGDVSEESSWDVVTVRVILLEI
jgi:hypothetical protein